MAMKFEKTAEGSYLLDVKGYVCPHPQLYTKSALSKIKPGDTLKILFDNASSGESIASMCDKDGNDIIERITNAGSFVWTVRKA